MLEFRVFDISNQTQPLKGRLPLTPGSYLTWFGFSEEGHLSSYDSKVFSAISVKNVTSYNAIPPHYILLDMQAEIVSLPCRVCSECLQANMVVAGSHSSG